MTIGFCMTFFSIFDVPVFWPILLIYFIILFVLTMKRQIKHMIQHKVRRWHRLLLFLLTPIGAVCLQYVPFSFGKKRYVKKGEDIRVK